MGAAKPNCPPRSRDELLFQSITNAFTCLFTGNLKAWQAEGRVERYEIEAMHQVIGINLVAPAQLGDAFEQRICLLNTMWSYRTASEEL
jgi:hypothetical protein